MLELRPNCECCNKDLPPESREARICTYECTFCAACAGEKLKGVCPNCGGNLVAVPSVPPPSWRKIPRQPAHPEAGGLRACDSGAIPEAIERLRWSKKAK